MSWVISAGLTSVTFPVNPQNITDENPVVESDFQVDGQQSVVVSEGLDVRTLTLKGFFYVAGRVEGQFGHEFCFAAAWLERETVWL